MIKNPEIKNERSEDLNENNLGVVQSGRILALGARITGVQIPHRRPPHRDQSNINTIYV